MGRETEQKREKIIVAGRKQWTVPGSTRERGLKWRQVENEELSPEAPEKDGPEIRPGDGRGEKIGSSPMRGYQTDAMGDWRRWNHRVAMGDWAMKNRRILGISLYQCMAARTPHQYKRNRRCLRHNGKQCRPARAVLPFMSKNCEATRAAPSPAQRDHDM